MCEHCGCSTPTASHTHSHDHGHDHPHPEPTRVLELQRNILAHNEHLAAHNREWLKQHDIVALNLISSPGTGKTYLLERTLEGLPPDCPAAVISGDQQTDRDAQRLRGKGAPVHQIVTHDACHLDAARIGQILPHVCTDATRLLIIENVGNLVCPAAFDLGETHKVALLSVTEGEDKPIKYPTLFINADLVVITKIDLCPHLDWDREECLGHIRSVNAALPIVELSARTGEGMDSWFKALHDLTSTVTLRRTASSA